MSWLERRSGPSSPEYYPDAADPDEAQLHADAAQWHYLLEIADDADTSQQGVEFRTQAGQLAAKWSRHPSLVRQHQWIRQRDAFVLWRDHPDKAARDLRELERAHAAGGEGVDEFGLRCLRQAGEQTGRVEPGITGSEQDSASWHSVAPPLAAGNVADPTPSPRNVLDRALGGPPSLLNLDEVGAIIADIDRALETAETLGASDAEAATATTAQGRRAPAAERSTPPPRQRQALQELQDLHAEHTRTAESFSDLGDRTTINAKVEALEAIRAQFRSAQAAAIQWGAPTEVITKVVQAGQDGTYWHDGPGDPRLATTTTGTPVDHPPDHHDMPGAPDPAAFAPNASNGVAIGQAVDAAAPATENSDWHTPEGPEPIRPSPPPEAAKDVDL
ncbi:hypothetical protein ACFYO1_02895 [Nocardia sp. NPDC006044]|uniref:hypothetical protein n=1 Tax=Nocardia sp. NPDC006044 TaxID=3364306 RepID=UPI00367F2D76